jgi:hypothetical protein
VSSTAKQSGGDGSKLAGTLGWQRDFWSAGVSADSYSREYLPANGLLDHDLPDTKGGNTFASYYRDYGNALVSQLRGDASYIRRYVGDGRLQRRTLYTGGSVELHQWARTGVWYSDGMYRPVGSTPGDWVDTMNHDHYWTGAVDFNTRSSWFGYGASTSSGQLGGGDYRYTNGYAWIRPTNTTFVNLATERLENFGTFDQTVITAAWDITPRQSVATRYVTAYYGSSYRLAYSLNVRKNVDFFAVYDREPALAAQLSAKIVIAFH